jgi:hypothetical protein
MNSASGKEAVLSVQSTVQTVLLELFLILYGASACDTSIFFTIHHKEHQYSCSFHQPPYEILLHEVLYGRHS